MDALRVGTRGSQLALFQAHTVADLLREQTGAAVEIVVIRTSGDRLAEAPLSEVGGKRLFVKEIEDALLDGAVDIAVHSSKDMPAIAPDGLAIGAVLAREDARDAVVMPVRANRETGPYSVDELVRALGRSPRIGTSSVRRTAQLRRLFPGAAFLPIRGNLDTRLRKLEGGDFDALVLAAAGLRRLDHADRISNALPVDVCVPAPGQGIIAVQIRAGDARVHGLVTRINDPVAGAALAAERAVVAALGGGCQMPIGAFAEVRDGRLLMKSIVVSVDGARAARADAEGPVAEAELVGADAARRLIDAGARDILAEVARLGGAVEGLQP